MDAIFHMLIFACPVFLQGLWMKVKEYYDSSMYFIFPNLLFSSSLNLCYSSEDKEDNSKVQLTEELCKYTIQKWCASEHI